MTETDDDVREGFRSRMFPVRGTLAGYAWLIEHLSLNTILPYRLHIVATVNTQQKTQDCDVHPVRRRPPDTLYGHLHFALRYEGVDLLILSQVFADRGGQAVQDAIDAKPTSAYARRLCFLYEWLTGASLTPPGGLGGAYTDVVDTKLQYAIKDADTVRRWRVRDNLPGTRRFCPMVSRTRRLDNHRADGLAQRAAATVQEVSPDVLRRASAFLLLKDSKASFEIEKEVPSKDRAERWARVIGQAGETELDIALLERLQRDLIEDSRFVQLGLRREGGFVGEHTSLGEPRPDHFSAPPDDVPDLLGGMVAYDRRTARLNQDPVLTAAALAFGFVYIHPFEDGNGRLHRYLIHHVLTRRGFWPEGIIAPVSAAIEDDMVAYRHTLEAVSRPMLTVIDWTRTEKGNVEVRNDVADFYRFFDATPHAEFLYACVEKAVDTMLPDEVRFLSARDRFHVAATAFVDMPERLLDLMFHMLRQNGGRFSERMRRREFEQLTDDEARAFEIEFGRATRNPPV